MNKRNFKKKLVYFWRKTFNIKKKYLHNPFIYINDKNEVSSEIENRLRWLDEEYNYAYDEIDSLEKAFITLNEKYKEYKGKIWIF